VLYRGYLRARKALSGHRREPLMAAGLAVAVCLVAALVSACGNASAPSETRDVVQEPAPKPAPEPRPGQPGRPGSSLPPEDRAPEPPPPPEPEVPTSIDEALDRLLTANLAFNAPRTLRLDETKEIQVLLSRGELVRNLQRRLTESGEREGAKIPASDEMDASLEGLGFEIRAVTPTQQPVGKGVTEWRWQIQPTEIGQHRLHLTLTAVIFVRTLGTADPHTAKKAIRTFDRTLTVESIPTPWHKAATGFLGDNWQWLIGTLLIPLGVALANFRKRKQSGPERKQSARERQQSGRFARRQPAHPRTRGGARRKRRAQR
jgi:hypothetical protein